MEKDKRIYDQHRSTNRKEFLSEIQKGPINKDRHYNLKVIRACIEYLDQKGIYEYQDFIDTLKKYGLKTMDITNYIIEFREFIDSKKDKNEISHTKWIILRSVRKANFMEKNLFLNRLAHEFPNQLLFFTKNYILNNFPNGINIDIFFDEFRNKVHVLHQQKLPQTNQAQTFLPDAGKEIDVIFHKTFGEIHQINNMNQIENSHNIALILN